MNTKLFNQAYAIVLGFKNPRLMKHFERSMQWLHDNAPAEEADFLAWAVENPTALKVFCNKTRTCIEAYEVLYVK